MKAVSAGTGPVTAMPRAAQRVDDGRDHLDFLAAEMSAFAGVRVEAADEDARRLDAERFAQALVEHDERPFERVRA